jgi:hypothetical protein
MAINLGKYFAEKGLIDDIRAVDKTIRPVVVTEAVIQYVANNHEDLALKLIRAAKYKPNFDELKKYEHWGGLDEGLKALKINLIEAAHTQLSGFETDGPNLIKAYSAYTILELFGWLDSKEDKSVYKFVKQQLRKSKQLP